MTTITKTLSAVLLALGGANAFAATLSLEPGTQTVSAGAVFSVDLVVSGLGDDEEPSVGAFDIDISFDPFDLALVGFGFGTELGDLGLGEAIDVSFGEYLPGVVNVAEVSFLTEGELDGAQPGTFVLATLDFMTTGLVAGETTAIDILSVLSLGDALGDPITIDATGSAEVTAVVPLPAALWLFAAALGGLAGVRRRRA